MKNGIPGFGHSWPDPGIFLSVDILNEVKPEN
jgi:hypothetical protein